MYIPDDIYPLIIIHLDYPTVLCFLRTCKQFLNSSSPKLLEGIQRVLSQLAKKELTDNFIHNLCTGTPLLAIPSNTFNCDLYYHRGIFGLMFSQLSKSYSQYQRKSYTVKNIPGTLFWGRNIYGTILNWLPCNQYISLFTVLDNQPITGTYITVPQFIILAHTIYTELIDSVS